LPDTEVVFYTTSLRQLLLQETKEAFEFDLNLKKIGDDENRPWSSEFIKYFESCIKPDIENLAKYAVKEICGDLFNDFTGISINQAEGLNKLFKYLLECKTKPLGVVNLALYQLSIYFSNEIKLGFANIGEYKLKTEFKHFSTEKEYVQQREVTDPIEIVKKLIDNNQNFNEIAGCSDLNVLSTSDSNYSIDSNTSNSNSNSISIPTTITTTSTVKASSNSNKTITNEDTDKDDIDDDFESDRIVSQAPTSCSINSDEEINGEPILTSSQKVNSVDELVVDEFYLNNGVEHFISKNPDVPLTISTIFNAKIAQGINLCENDKVTFDKNLKVYHCIQESKVFMINLLPEEKCTCIEKKGCFFKKKIEFPLKY
jgi:hypothetical protein